MTAQLAQARRDQLARAAAAFYRRKCWWADFDDLVQTGQLAIVRALENYDPTIGVPVDGYCWGAMMRALERVLWRDSSPVSGGSHRPREAYAGLYRAALPPEDMTCAVAPFVETRTPERLVSDAEWEARVRERLAAISLPEIVDVMLDPSRVEEAARKLRVSKKQVRVAVNVTLNRASTDSTLHDLLRERAG